MEQLHLWSLAGHNSILGTANQRTGNIGSTPLFDELKRVVVELQPRLVLLDPLANLFGGNEIIRLQAQQFIGLLRGLAIEHDAAVVLAAHPSLTGMREGTGSSGSTGWNNSCRSRILVERAEREKDAVDEDARTLTVNKSNYGRIGQHVQFRWQNGVFVPISGDPVAIAKREREADDKFVVLLGLFIARGISLSPNPSNIFAPKVMSEEPGVKAAGFTDKVLKAAMGRVLDQGRVRITTAGPKSRTRRYLDLSQ